MSQETLAEALAFGIRAGLLGEGFAATVIQPDDGARFIAPGPYALVPTDELRHQIHRILDEEGEFYAD